MNAIFPEVSETMMMTPCGITELVRGHEQPLIDRVAPLLREQNVVLDLRNIQRIDAAGIAALISLYGIARTGGHTFAVCNLSHHVQEILSLVGLEPILTSHDVVPNSHSDVCIQESAA